MPPSVRIYIWLGQALFIGPAAVADEHRHHMVQIIAGLQGPYRVRCAGEWHAGRVALIAPDQPHCFEATGNMQALLIVEPESLVGQYLLREHLRGAAFQDLDLVLNETLSAQLLGCANGVGHCDEAAQACANLVAAVTAGIELSRPPVEPRIGQALMLLRQLPLKQISAKVIAQQVYLSEARLIHLFTQQVGIAFRSYLLWLRLIDAVQLVIQGETFTTAAHEAGFADSAHFSRVFKRTFGMSARFVFKNSQYIQVISCSG